MDIIIKCTDKEVEEVRCLCRLYNRVHKIRLPYRKIIKMIFDVGNGLVLSQLLEEMEK